MTGPAVEPVATYRFQLTPGFGFDAVAGLLDHVARLGASHVYLSPIAQAVPASTHGYDVVDHAQVRAEFGGAAGFERLLDAVAALGLAVIVDHVPNHVSAARPDLNPRWWELLRDGPASPAADWFDVDWELTGGQVVLPVLGGPLASAIADAEVAVDGDALVLYGGARRLPLAAGTAGLPLADLLAAQHYRLVDWRDPLRNVRRFFTVDDLVAVRVEHAPVAAAVDTLPERYAGHPGFGGVRVDHVDGLADPAGYLAGLRGRVGDAALVYVEKILAPGERLPDGWPVDGTTGYEAARLVDHLLLDRDAADACTAQWEHDSGSAAPFHDAEREAMREVAAEALAPDVARLVRLAARAAGGEAGEVERLVTSLPRYRTYLPDDPEAAGLVGAISGGPVAQAILHPATPGQRELRTRWQQLTGPVMAKGAEDRAFYRYLRLASACEVGGAPGTFGIDVAAFHAGNRDRERRWPRSLLAGSTHDTKRSDDVRARSAAMTWLRPWGPRWSALVAELAARCGLDGATVSLGLQTALTVPGLDAERFAAYLVKACREAARHTSWEDPDPEYEARLGALAAALLAQDLEWAAGLDAAAPGVSLAATLLRLMSPGVPDVYQGTERFTFRLVDPDNRVPPDWDAVVRGGRVDATVAELWAAGSADVKTALVRAALDVRRRNPGGAYAPIDAGPGAVAFARGERVVVVARRGLAAVESSLALPAGRWYDVLDPGGPTLAGTVDAASLVGSGRDLSLPVALLERDD